MKRVRVFVVGTLALLCLCVAAQATDVIYNGFSSDPFDLVEDAYGTLNAFDDVTGFGIEDWTFEARISVAEWGPYGQMRIGVKGAEVGWNLFSGMFFQPDSGIKNIALYAFGYDAHNWGMGLAGGEIPGPAPRYFTTMSLQFNSPTSPDGTAGFRLRLYEDANPTPIYESAYVGFVDPTPAAICLQVTNTDGMGTIAYNPGTGFIDYYAYAGNPGGTPYEQLGSIEGMALVHGLQDNVLDPIPEPSSIVALAGGLVALLGIRRRKA